MLEIIPEMLLLRIHKVHSAKMRSTIIQKYIRIYKSRLSRYDFRALYKWECLKNYHDHWDIEARDFYQMFDKSFSSQISNRLWSKDQYYPKKMMLAFIQKDKEFVRFMFRDLLNEKKDLPMRMDRFRFYCDEMLAEIKN